MLVIVMVIGTWYLKIGVNKLDGDGGGKNAAGVHGGEGWGIEYDRWMIFSDLYTKRSRR